MKVRHVRSTAHLVAGRSVLRHLHSAILTGGVWWYLLRAERVHALMVMCHHVRCGHGQRVVMVVRGATGAVMIHIWMQHAGPVMVIGRRGHVDVHIDQISQGECFRDLFHHHLGNN